MNNAPIKCASKDFTKASFYLIESYDEGKRLVASLGDKIHIRTLLTGFINEATETVEIKIRDFDNVENPIDYDGLIDIESLHKIMADFEDVIFHNGYHDLMIRNTETGENIVFDEHGLVFIYSAKDYSDVLLSLGSEYRPGEKLTYEYDHFHYCAPDGQARLSALIDALDLQVG